MPYQHPSWNWSQWENLWPTPTPHPPFSTSACSVDFKRLYQSDIDVLEAMTGDHPVRQVSLASIRQFSQRLEHWMQSPHVENQLTLPPSVAGFHRALAYEIENNASLQISDGCFAVALIDLRPGDIARALKLINADKLSEDWKVLLAQISLEDKPIFKYKTPVVSSKWLNTTPTPKTILGQTQQELTEDVLPTASTSVTPLNSTRFDFSPAQKIHGELFVQWLEKVKKESETTSVQRQNFDGLIKQNVFKYQGASPGNFNHWLEDFAIGALATLSIENLAEIIALWPTHQDMTFTDPVKTLSENSFWQNIRRMNTATRTYFLETVLPTVVSPHDWSHDTKYELLPNMLQKTEKYEFLAEERLKLWLAWGGNLDAVVSKKLEEMPSAFEMVETQTARQWIEEQNCATWTSVLQKLGVPRKAGMAL